jgi:histone H3/H4
MKALFWLSAGVALGVFGYRYYEQNGGRLPMLEELMGGRTDEIAEQAQQAAHEAKRRTQRAVSETAGSVARETVSAVAEEIAEGEEAKRRLRSAGQE